MAKDKKEGKVKKKDKKKQEVKQSLDKETRDKKKKKTEEPEIKGIIFDNFQICKADKLNWAIEPKNEKGGFSKTKRKYFPRLESALFHSLEEMTLSLEEEIQLKKAIKKIKGYKEEILKAIKEYKLDG